MASIFNAIQCYPISKKRVMINNSVRLHGTISSVECVHWQWQRIFLSCQNELDSERTALYHFKTRFHGTSVIIRLDRLKLGYLSKDL